jgi:hypothetical protein
MRCLEGGTIIGTKGIHKLVLMKVQDLRRSGIRKMKINSSVQRIERIRKKENRRNTYRNYYINTFSPSREVLRSRF